MVKSALLRRFGKQEHELVADLLATKQGTMAIMEYIDKIDTLVQLCSPNASIGLSALRNGLNRYFKM